jgi:hypothetical protein
MLKISKIQSRWPSSNPQPIQQIYVGQIRIHNHFIKVMKHFIGLMNVNHNNANKFIWFISKFSKLKTKRKIKIFKLY